MVRTVRAIIDEEGNVSLLEPVHLAEERQAIVTILDDAPANAQDTAILGEKALAEDWDRPEEDAAWSRLQRVQ